MPRKVEYILLSSLKRPKSLPINPSTLSLVNAMIQGRYVEKPIKVHRYLHNGEQIIRDGRHRYVAHRLLGKKYILARISIIGKGDYNDV